MQVHKDLDQLPSFRNAVVTIGTFDGVHLGHRQVIERLNTQARVTGGESVIITFHPHPRRIVSSAILGIRLINTLDEKLELLRDAGVDHVVVVPFTEAFANQPAEEYIRNFLVGRFHPHTVIIGYDHRFGRDRKGDYRLLEQYAPKLGFQLQEIPKHLLNDIGISSTRIREAMLNGQPGTAASLLGYEFFFSGLVVDGDKLGRQLGYPTANLRVEDEEKLVPANGIYAVYASLENVPERIRGMMSIGFRPTVDGKKRVIEVNLFDFNRDIYGQHLRVYTKKYLREEVKFDSLDALVKQIDQDKLDSLAVL
ncbi:MAG: bifunctional riboflavin kinase/FAD synthetase [Chitinophagaceae bacterium]|nr:MAG: bifunctional riboflavin kinase/FAD synthetase [Chitinophagaceae bacterium]